MQQLNLDWILSKLKTLLRLVPDNGAVGQILRRTRDGAEWSDETGGGGAVSSVNGQTGAVVLDAADVGALPDSYEAPVTSVNGETGEVTLDLGVTGILGYREGVGTVTLKGLITMTGYSGVRIDSPSGNNIRFACTKGSIGLGNVDNVRQYSASNPPPYPVTSVNGQTGAVVIPTGGAVDSVNGQTGTVVLGKSNIGLGNVDNVQQYSADNPPPYPVTSVNGQTGAVVVQGGGMTMTLLWTNPSPTVAFAAQTVSLDLSSYEAVMVKFFTVTDTPRYFTHIMFIDGNSWAVSAIGGSASNRYNRLVTVSTTGLVFTNGYMNGTSGTKNAVPTEIYGIKGMLTP
ncbi:MAG: hypothetical protein IIW86_01595 [Clostridia bacterium]|nr:hypothetical protein [Clostridia bacterium]